MTTKADFSYEKSIVEENSSININKEKGKKENESDVG
jgi:hypothetical protein